MTAPASRREPRRQAASLAPLLGTWAVVAAVLCLLAMQRNVPTEQLFLDAAYLSGEPWYTGLFSNLGVLAWTTAVVAALGGGWVAAQTGRPTARRFLFTGAGATAFLLADDLFQFHADALPALGLPKLIGQVVVTAPTVLWLARYRHEIERTRWSILAAALGGLAVSVVIDRFADDRTPLGLFLEDSAKFLGIVAFALYLVLTTLDITRSTIRAAMARVADVDPTRTG